MTQREIDRAVACATGETVSRVSRQGFSLLEPTSDMDANYVDWDELDAERPTLFPVRLRPDRAHH